MTTVAAEGSDGAGESRSPGILSFAVALITYIGLGLAFKSVVLNWLVGPAYMVMVLHVLPTGLRRLRNRWRAR